MHYLRFHLVVQRYSLTACFKPRRALLFASEIMLHRRHLKRFWSKLEGLQRVPDSRDEIVIS